MVKHSDPAIKYLKTKLGHDTLKEKAIKAFARKDEEKEKSTEASVEESKECPEDDKADVMKAT